MNKELNAANKRFVPLIEFLAFLCMLTSVILSSYLIALKKLDLSTIITFYGYMTLLTGTAGNLSSIILFYVNSKQSIIRMTETLKGYKDESNEEKMVYCEIIDEIKLEKVSFGYTNKRILNEISLTLQKGNITTITGEISCGKTTLVDIIAGLNTRYSGIIKVNHVDLKSIDIVSYRTNVGYATQEPIFVHGTILENITLGKEGFTDEQLLNTLNISAVSEIISCSTKQQSQGH